MKRILAPIFFIAVGIFIAFPLFSMTYYTMVRTSTPQFCASCHEIQPAYEAWKTSSHVNNGQGIVADCMDCHLPAPQDTFDFFYAKTFHGIKDIYVHFAMGSSGYDRAVNRNRVYATMKNEQCRKCHRNILYIPEKRGAMLAHRAVLFPRPGLDKRCVDCHRRLVHVDRGQYHYKGFGAPYRAAGF